MLALLLLLPLLSSSTLLFYLPDDASSSELRATIKFGIRQLARGLWYDLEHKIISTNQHNMVKSLVSNLDQDITAILGVFSEQELRDITTILDAYSIPTFVLNKLSSTPVSPNIYQTRPSVQFDLDGLQNILEHYGWEQIMYYIQANTSAVGLVHGKGRCWNKTVLETKEIREQTCRRFSVVVLVGNSRFQRKFIGHYTSLGCRNMIVVQYFLGSSVPTVLHRSVQNNTDIGDLLMLVPKSYPVIETGTNPKDGAKYTCLHPSCLRYKIKQQYRQTESVLLLLDSLNLLEIMLREHGTITQSNIRDVSFMSASGDISFLLEQGFTYNRLNVFKIGTRAGLDMLGWVGNQGLELLPTTWQSTARDFPLSAPGLCFGNSSALVAPVVEIVVTGPYSSNLTKILSLFMITVMLVAVVTLYITQRNRDHALLDTSVLFPYFLSCVVIALSSCMLLDSLQYSTCVMLISRDMAEFVFFSLTLYFIMSHDSTKLPSVAVTGALLFGKFLVLTWNFMERTPAQFCVDATFRSSSNFMLSGLLVLNLLLVTVKHWGRLTQVTWLFLALLVALAAEASLYCLNLPPSCAVALYTARAVITTAAIVLSRVDCKPLTGFEGVYVEEKDTVSYYESHRGPRGHSAHCMETNLEDRGLLDHVTCQNCNGNSVVPCYDDVTYEDFTCQASQVSCRYAESPQLFWDDEMGNGRPPHPLSPGFPRFLQGSSSEPRSCSSDLNNPEGRAPPYLFPERIKFERSPGTQDQGEMQDVGESTGTSYETVESVEDDVQTAEENNAPVVLYVDDEIRCYQNTYELEDYGRGGGQLSEISEEDEEEETQIRAIFRSDPVKHADVVSDTANTEPADSILDEIVLLKMKNEANNIKYPVPR